MGDGDRFTGHPLKHMNHPFRFFNPGIAGQKDLKKTRILRNQLETVLKLKNLRSIDSKQQTGPRIPKRSNFLCHFVCVCVESPTEQRFLRVYRVDRVLVSRFEECTRNLETAVVSPTKQTFFRVQVGGL